MSKILLPVNKLAGEVFAPFGDVIEAGADYREVNQGTARRYCSDARLDISERDGQPRLDIFRAQARQRPIAVKLVERHPLSSQTFYPVDSKPFLVLVAPRGDRVEPADLQVFLSNGKQGVNYHRGIWHHPLLALHGETDFIVVDRDGDEHNCDEYFFPDDMEILIDY